MRLIARVTWAEDVFEVRERGGGVHRRGIDGDGDGSDTAAKSKVSRLIKGKSREFALPYRQEYLLYSIYIYLLGKLGWLTLTVAISFAFVR